MSLLKADCPRCKTASVTFDVLAQKSRGIVQADWVERFEVFAVCRHCHKPTIFSLDNKTYASRGQWKDPTGTVNYNGFVNDALEVRGHVSLKDMAADDPPEHLPDNIESVYREGATCLAVKCWNASAAMFRTCIDLATKGMLPPLEPSGEGPNAKIRRSLGLRMEWLFANGKLPPDLKDLAECIKEDGNDGAHEATLGENEALDIRDFTFHLLERLYTMPMRIELAAARRVERRGQPT